MIKRLLTIKGNEQLEEISNVFIASYVLCKHCERLISMPYCEFTTVMGASFKTSWFKLEMSNYLQKYLLKYASLALIHYSLENSQNFHFCQHRTELFHSITEKNLRAIQSRFSTTCAEYVLREAISIFFETPRSLQEYQQAIKMRTKFQKSSGSYFALTASKTYLWNFLNNLLNRSNDSL